MDALDAELESGRQPTGQPRRSPCKQQQQHEEQHDEQPQQHVGPEEQQILVGVWLADVVRDVCNQI